MLLMMATVCSTSAEFGEKLEPEDQVQTHRLAGTDSTRREPRRYSTRYKSDDSQDIDKVNLHDMTTVVVAPKLFENEAQHSVNYEQGIKIHELQESVSTTSKPKDELLRSPTTEIHQGLNSNGLRYRHRPRSREIEKQKNTPTKDGKLDEISLENGNEERFTRRGVKNNGNNKRQPNEANEYEDKRQLLPYGRLRTTPSRRSNETIQSRWQGHERLPQSFTNSRQLRLRSRQATSAPTTESSKVIAPIQEGRRNKLPDNNNAKDGNDLTENIFRSLIPDKENVKSGDDSVKFADLLLNFQNHKSHVKVTKRPLPTAQSLILTLPPIISTTPTTSMVQDKLKELTSSVTMRSTENYFLPSLPVSEFISPTAHIRSTVYQFGPSFSAIEHTKDSSEKPSLNKDLFIDNHKQFKTQQFHLDAQQLRENFKHFRKTGNAYCAGLSTDQQKECEMRTGRLPTHILESTRDIIKQAETEKKSIGVKYIKFMGYYEKNMIIHLYYLDI